MSIPVRDSFRTCFLICVIGSAFELSMSELNLIPSEKHTQNLYFLHVYSGSFSTPDAIQPDNLLAVLESRIHPAEMHLLLTDVF